MEDSLSLFQMSAYQLSVILVLAVAFLLPESGNAQANGYQYAEPKRPAPVSMPQKYCGKKLSNALQIICDGVYNSMFKKNGQGECARRKQPVDERKSHSTCRQRLCQSAKPIENARTNDCLSVGER